MKLKKLFVVFFILTGVFFSVSITTKAEDLPTAKTYTEQTGINASAGSYELISPIGNLSKIPDVSDNGFSDFVNLLIRIAIALAGAIAVVMLIIGGIQYMGTDSVWEKGESRSRMTSAIIGLVLLLTSYFILFNINPDLVDIRIGGLRVTEGEWEKISFGGQYRLSQTSGTSKTFTRTKFYDKIKEVSKRPEYNINHCLLQVAIQRESGGAEGLVGHDEDAPSSGIKSRKDFIASGKRYKGSTFPIDNSLITKSSHLNDDHGTSSIYSASNPAAEDLGLDWRFSHGVGMFGVTFYPEGNSYGDYKKGVYSTSLKKWIKPKDLFNTDTDIAMAAEIMAKNNKACSGDIENTYRKYGSGECTGRNAFTNTEAPLRKNLFDQCVTQDK